MDFMKNNNNRGFSIVELLLALALLLIALGLGYNLLFFARNSFERSEERWMEQNEVVAVSNIIYDSLNEAYYIEIVADEAGIPSAALDFYGAFFVDETGATIYESKSGSTVVETELPGDYLVLSFSKETYTINEYTYTYNDLLNFSVVSNDLSYTISPQVHLDNMNRDRTIQGIDTGAVIVFQTKEVVETVPEDLYDTLCFVATAAYESPMNPSVRLLRRFRDEYLLETDLGTRFVEFYYDNSPPVAKVIEESSVLRFASRAVLYPLVGFVSLVMNPLHFMNVMTGLFMAAFVYKRKKPGRNGI